MKKHKRHYNKSNIILENLKMNRSKGSSKPKNKRFKEKRDSDQISVLINKFKSRKQPGELLELNVDTAIQKHSRPTFPSTKTKKAEEAKNASKDHSARRKNDSAKKWKLSPYRKLATKISKMKSMLHDQLKTQDGQLYTGNKHSLQEYSSFIHGKKKKPLQKFPSSKRRVSLCLIPSAVEPPAPACFGLQSAI